MAASWRGWGDVLVPNFNIKATRDKQCVTLMVAGSVVMVSRDQVI